MPLIPMILLWFHRKKPSSTVMTVMREGLVLAWHLRQAFLSQRSTLACP